MAYESIRRFAMELSSNPRIFFTKRKVIMAHTRLCVTSGTLSLAALLAFGAPHVRADVDMQPIALAFDPTGGGLYDVTPTVFDRSNESGDVPLEFDLYVNGSLAATSQMHSYRITTACSPAERPCSDGCVKRYTSGTMNQDLDGTCVESPLFGNACGCSTTGRPWPVHSVQLKPGDEVTVVLDPRNLVPEVDETNNEYTVVFTAAIPVIGVWGKIAVGTLIGMFGVVFVARKVMPSA